MSLGLERPLVAQLRHELDALRGHWSWFVRLVGARVALTLLVACFLMAGGNFKILAAVGYRFTAWGWSLASGVIDLILEVMVWREWPGSALWVIGLFAGINLVFRGFNWVALGLALWSLPRPQTA
jgi:uncharacterized membrane protein HdeD (DUF308 family)